MTPTVPAWFSKRFLLAPVQASLNPRFISPCHFLIITCRDWLIVMYISIHIWSVQVRLFHVYLSAMVRFPRAQSSKTVHLINGPIIVK